jgi:hypothetical protein
VAAYGWVRAHPAAWAQALYVDQYHLPLALGERLIAETGPATFESLPGPYVGPQQALADLYVDAGEIPAHLDAAKELDPRFDAVTREAQSS